MVTRKLLDVLCKVTYILSVECGSGTPKTPFGIESLDVLHTPFKILDHKLPDVPRVDSPL